MLPLHPQASPARGRVLTLIAVVAAIVAIAEIATRTGASSVEPRAHAPHDHSGMTMGQAEMQRAVREWYAQRSEHGGQLLGSGADTFLVLNFRFDTDASVATQVDTAKILVGQSVLFKWVEGIHTTTSGEPDDPDAGSIWDHGMDSSPANQEFSVQFNQAGTFPFFCVPHGSFFNMKGVVVVRSNVGVEGREAVTLGFTRAPGPNPTRAGISFQFALRDGGRARAEVFDVGGRRIASVLDRVLGPGASDGHWDGRTASGRRAPAGVYYLRLTLPGVEQARRIVIER